MTRVMKKDPYKILGISRDAEPEVIKAAYRALARKYHPDVNSSPEAEDEFKVISDAYNRINNREPFIPAPEDKFDFTDAAAKQPSSRKMNHRDDNSKSATHEVDEMISEMDKSPRPMWFRILGKILERVIESNPGNEYDYSKTAVDELLNDRQVMEEWEHGGELKTFLQIYKLISRFKGKHKKQTDVKA